MPIAPGVSFSGANINELSISGNDSSSTSDVCDVALDDFQYQEANLDAFSFLIDCLDSKYKRTAPSTWKQLRNEGSESGPESNDITPRELLQPFEQAASLARSLGRYGKERELLYKQKRLELFVEKDEGSRLSPRYIQLSISDFLYGFSYQRFKALKFFILVWLVGTFLAFRRILHKQYEIVDKVISTRALEDKLFTKTSAPRVSLNRLLKNNNLIAKLFFARLLEDKSFDKLNDFDLYVQFEEADANLGKIFDADKAAKLEQQSPDYIKVDPEGRSDQRVSSQHDQNLRGFLDMVDAKGIEVLGYCKHIFPGSGKWIFDIDPQLSNRKDLRMVNVNERAIVEYRYPHLSGESGKFSALRTRWSFIFAASIIFVAVSLFLYLPDSTRFIWRWSLFLFPTLIAGLVFLQNHFNRWDFRVAWLAAVFSLDILLPIINLDEQLQSFVFEGAEGGIRLYFLAEKLLAAVLAGILLPIFFVTGL